MIDAATPLAHVPLGLDRTVAVAGSKWGVYRFDDGAVLVEAPCGTTSVRADTPRGLVVAIPAEATADLGTVGEAIALAIEAADRYAVIGRVATVIQHGVVLQAPLTHPSRTQHATVGPWQFANGESGYACVLYPGGLPMPTWQNTRTGPVAAHEADHSPFAAARAFVDLVGAVMAVVALRKAQERASCAETRLDAERDRLVAVLRARLDASGAIARMLWPRRSWSQRVYDLIAADSDAA